MGAVGITTSGLVFEGDTGVPLEQSVVTEEYNGTSFTEVADLSITRNSGAMAGTSSSALTASGTQVSKDTLGVATEEWTLAASVETVAFD